MAAPEKAFLELEGGERIPCLYNPAELRLTRSNSWDATPRPGRPTPRLRFGGARPGVLEVSLFFDTTATGRSVAEHTGRVVEAMDIDPTLPGSDERAGDVRPPLVTFHWGEVHSFRSVIADLALAYTYFSPTGTPLRATLDLVLQQFEPEHAFGPQNPTSGTPQPHRVHRVQSGETLDRIAARYYGDATRWRPLAAANGVTDPLRLVPGTLLAVPGIEDL